MNSITPAQIRAGRALLGWSQGDLADKSGITERAIGKIEKGETDPHDNTMKSLIGAFESYGVEFLPNDGLRRRHDSITVIEGDDANEKLLDDVFKTLRDRAGEEILIGGLREPPEEDEERRKNIQKHVVRLKSAGITERLLIEEGDTNLIAPAKWYRWIPKENFTPTRFQIYGNKIALVSMGPPRKIVIIENQPFADSFRALFNFAWKHSMTPDLPEKGKKA